MWQNHPKVDDGRKKSIMETKNGQGSKLTLKYIDWRKYFSSTMILHDFIQDLI